VSGDKGKYPDFVDNVRTVETRDFWRDASISPRNQGFHYNGNAETYMLVGDAMGRAMVTLLEKREK
jgi:alpha-galactosidase